jgi:hypothetical protein
MKKIISLFSLALLTMSAWGANTFVKVTSLSQLESGKHLILVNEGNSCAMGELAGTSTPYGSAVAINIIDDVIDIEGTDVVELTFEDGWLNDDGVAEAIFTMGGDDAFLTWSSGNSLTTAEVCYDNSVWIVSSTDDGFMLINLADNTRKLQYNASSPRFACYTSSQQPAVLYVEDASVAPPVTVAAPTLPESQEFENSLSVSITNNEEGADIMYALNDGEFTEYTEALTITETTTVHAKAVKGEVESAVVSATYTKVEPVVLTKPYVKVNSVDELEVGKKYILVNEERKLAMGEITGGSSHYGRSIEIPIVEDVAYIGDTQAVELTLGEGTMDVLGHATWTFEINGSGSYILWDSGNSLDAITGDGATGAVGAQWLVSETEDGIVLLNKSDNARKLQYNASSPRFACYTSNQQPAVLYVEYVPQEDEGIATLAEANALENDEAFAFSGNAVVTVYRNGYLFLRDESGFGQIRNVTGGNFENGQVLNPNWDAVKAGENGWNWFTDAEGLIASSETNAELAAPIVLTGAVDDSMLNAYVCIENQTPSFFPARSFLLPDGTRIFKTENYWAGDADATTGNYNVYGVIVKVGDQYYINITDYANYVEPQPEFVRGDVNKSGNVNIEDVTALIDYLLGGDASLVNLDACDCDESGSVNIEDVTALIDYLLNGTWN